MKSFLIILIAFTIGINSAPQESETGTETLSDEQKIENVLNEIRDAMETDIQRETRRNDFRRTFNSFTFEWSSQQLNAVDRKCMLQEYQRLDIVDRIPSSYRQLQRGDTDVLFSFMAAGLNCYDKFNIFVEYGFEMLMTQGILVRAFIDDPEMGTIKKYLTCANYYAHKNEFWNPEDYSLEYQLDGEVKDACEETIELMEAAWKKHNKSFFRHEVQESNVECYSQVFRAIKKILVKYPLLVQVDLTAEQHDEEFVNLKRDVRGVIKRFNRCASLHEEEEREDY